MSIKGKGVVLFHGVPPFALKLSWSSCCPRWCSQPSSSTGALCPGAQTEQPLHPASVARIWLHIKIGPDFAKGSAQWCVSLTQSLLSLLPETVALLISTTSHMPFIFWSNLLHTDALLLPNCFYLKVVFLQFCYRNQKASGKEGERDAVCLCLKSRYVLVWEQNLGVIHEVVKNIDLNSGKAGFNTLFHPLLAVWFRACF